MTLRLRYRTLGGHVHIRAFLKPGPPETPGTFAACGELTFRVDEWDRIARDLVGSPFKPDLQIEIVEDE